MGKFRPRVMLVAGSGSCSRSVLGTSFGTALGSRRPCRSGSEPSTKGRQRNRREFGTARACGGGAAGLAAGKTICSRRLAAWNASPDAAE